MCSGIESGVENGMDREVLTGLENWWREEKTMGWRVES